MFYIDVIDLQFLVIFVYYEINDVDLQNNSVVIVLDVFGFMWSDKVKDENGFEVICWDFV